MTQPESRLSSKIIKALNKEPKVFAWKNHGNEYTMAGLPDISVIANGHSVHLETKMPNKRHNTTAVQELVMHKMRMAGGTATVVTSVPEALGIVRQFLDDVEVD